MGEVVLYRGNKRPHDSPAAEWDLNVDNVHYLVCTHTHKCRETCQDHGNVDGRCKLGFPNLWPVCERLPPNCH
ncbi:hypothetical protein E2562_002253 [Oryza meyeriana var. granulata]|uniref:Uncharacterized protein n=1 Tax=Oryza meyeriana var. granulata TaxID=110450 RepID=A0A6G1BIG1_9ORYZ|nr:hypothetical protein E2562_002253 [Oryza meyeriana var. granulata]